MSAEDYPAGGAHEDQLFSGLISLADTLVEGFDVIDLADRLMGTFQDLLRVTSAGIMLHDPQGGLQVIASTSEEMRLLELLEIQSNGGPCLTAFDTNEVVIVDDLAEARERWPKFVPQAQAQGLQSAYSLPMSLREQTVGAVNLFSTEKSALSGRDLQVAHVLTSMATIGLVNHRANRHQEMLAEQLQVALKQPDRHRAGEGCHRSQRRGGHVDRFQPPAHCGAILAATALGACSRPCQGKNQR